MKFLFFLTVLLFPSTLWGQVVLTEVMFDPLDNENADEFIELYNAGTVPVSLRGYAVGDQDRQEMLAFPAARDSLAPGQFAVIFDADYVPETGTYRAIIPATALLLFVDDRTLGSAGLSNSRAETVVLLDAAGDTAAVYTYSTGNLPGYSDEKRDTAAGDRPENWGDSLVLYGTPGAKNSVAPKAYDLGIEGGQPAVQPRLPRLGETSTLQFRVSNRGREAVSGASLRVTANDSLPVALVPVTPLLPAEATDISVVWQTAVAGSVLVRAEILLAEDGNAQNNIFAIRFPVAWPLQAVLINEIMLAPVRNEPEWVELFNALATPIPLAGWKLRDASGRTGLVALDGAATVPAQGFAVLASDALLRELYPIPASVPVVSLIGFPLLNNEAETLALLDFSGSSIDSVAYQVGGDGEFGLSLERISADSISTAAANWRFSRDAAGATPGRLNSVSPVARDLALAPGRLTLNPARPKRGEIIEIGWTLENAGRLPLRLDSCALYIDLNADGLWSANELVDARAPAEILAPQDSAMCVLHWQSSTSGRFAARIGITAEGDRRPENNAAAFTVPVGYLPGDLAINEMMPVPASGDVEWVELVNPGTLPVNLRGWQLADAHAPADSIAADVFVAPGAFVLLASDSLAAPLQARTVALKRWPALNNTSDTVILRDFHGTVIDSVVYSLPSDALPGISYERINPRVAGTPANWGLSAAVSGATPGEQNSLFIALLPQTCALAASPNPFSPDSDGRDDHLLISYALPLRESFVDLRVYNLRGRLVRQLLNHARSGPARQLIWDGRNAQGRLLKMGIYILYLQAIDAESGRLLQARTTVVLAKKL